MIRNFSLMKRQEGAIAIMAGILLFVLVGMLALAVDLGHVYIARTGLQNGADAAALAGARQLNDSLAGINAGVADAIGIARHNEYDFTKAVGTDASDAGLTIRVGDCPDDGCMRTLDTVTSDAAAFGLSYMEVSTGNRSLDSWFAGIWNILNFDVSARAVAGRYVIKSASIGVCAVSTDVTTEFGFIRGVAYNVPDLNPLSNGVPIWINPVDTPGSGTCDPKNGNTPVLAPYVCTGRSAIDVKIPGGYVWVNTGSQAVMNGPLNSRFADPKAYTGGQACDPSSAPPDVNVQQYDCVGPKVTLPVDLAQVPCDKNLPGGLSATTVDWMNPTPAGQTIGIWSGGANPGKPFYFPHDVAVDPASSGTRPPAPTAADFANYGVLWSAVHEMNASTGEDRTTADWPALYGGSANANYPDPPPYLQTSGTYFRAPPPGSYTPRAGRRVLNLAIINCSGITGMAGQSCSQKLPLLGVGRFFMQKQANLPKELVGEFVGLATPPLPSAQITLFR
ncbi:MAG TPA: Tad domain-containing protein [Noviherbaspirillum sp.]|uniref:Tad domain-containing protein n=1 Tax=Noviherbaspirillum sp. TaxID=1926288 RepID=UPI002B4A617F|nr:Tad domain-containing protein [Noviherbaspirillum sp.]HJV84028.1 Tad domain-containing protein [Noviherbaspirillum sp.]